MIFTQVGELYDCFTARGATVGGSSAEQKGRWDNAYSPLRAKSANTRQRRSQVGFSGARADRVRGFVGSRAIAARAAVAFA